MCRKDDGGEYWHIVVGAAFGVASQAIGDLLYAQESGKSFWDVVIENPGDYMQAAFSGAISAAVGNPLAAGAINTLVGTAVGQATDCLLKKEEWTGNNYWTAVKQTAITEVTSLVGGVLIDGIDALKPISNKAKAETFEWTFENIDSQGANTIWGSVTTFVTRRLGW